MSLSMASQFGSVGCTITKKTTDTPRKETLKVIVKTLAAHRGLPPSTTVES